MNKLTTNSFLIEDAVKYGAEEAIFLYNIRFWVSSNQAKESEYHFKQGRYWTYMSKKGFTKWFPFWTEKQIARIVKNLEDNGAIIRNSFNKMGNDQTTWYALTDKESWPSQTGSQPSQTGRPLPDSTTDISKVSKEKNSQEAFEEELKKIDINSLSAVQRKFYNWASTPGLPSWCYEFCVRGITWTGKRTDAQKEKDKEIEQKVAGLRAVNQMPKTSPTPVAPVAEQEIDQGALGRAYYKRLREGKQS